MTSPSRGWGRSLPVLALGLCALLGLMHVLARRQSGFLSVQGQRNVQFVANPSLVEALEAYPKLRPPLFPILQWFAARAGLRATWFNELLFGLALLVLLVYSRSALPTLHPLLPAAFFAIFNPNYVNLYQNTAEILVVPLHLLFLLLLLRRRDAAGDAGLWRLAAVASALCASRYFSLFFAVPALAFESLRRSSEAWRRRLTRTAALAAVAILPCLLWMAVTYRETGYLTGADRFEPRHLPESVQHWTQLQGFGATARLLAKTCWIDFLSPDSHASLAVVTRAYTVSTVEVAMAVLAALAALVAAAAAVRNGGGDRAARLTVGLLVLYFAATLAIWSAGNNDPLYGRFLYPGYPFLVLAAFHAYAAVKRTGWGVSFRVPFWALGAALGALHLLRDWMARPVPFR